MFLVGLVWRLGALALVMWAAAIPLTLFIMRAREGLAEEKVYEYASIGAALLVFPALIFLSWWDSAMGSIVPLIMLALIMSAVENTDPEYHLPPSSSSSLLLPNRSVLLVGASRGIGLALARSLLAQGARLVATVRPSPESLPPSLNLTHPSTSGAGTLLSLVPLDLGDSSSVSSFVPRLRAAVPDLGPLDVVIVNSGVFCAAEPPSADGIERTAAINFVGLARLVESLMPLLKPVNATVLFSSSASSRNWEGGSEALVNIQDLLHGDHDDTILEPSVESIELCMQRYARSKALVNAFSLRMARDFPKTRFFSVFPNPTHTDMLVEGMANVARALKYPAFFSPGTRLFDEFNLFWVKALSRSPDRVAVQYLYGIYENNTLETNGCAYFGECCLQPQQYELDVVDKVRALY